MLNYIFNIPIPFDGSTVLSKINYFFEVRFFMILYLL